MYHAYTCVQIAAFSFQKSGVLSYASFYWKASNFRQNTWELNRVDKSYIFECGKHGNPFNIIFHFISLNFYKMK